MQPFVLVWFQLSAARQRVRETFEPSALPTEAAHQNSSPIVAEPDSDIAVRKAGPTSPEATFIAASAASLPNLLVTQRTAQKHPVRPTLMRMAKAGFQPPAVHFAIPGSGLGQGGRSGTT